ncbi:hypothetical protein ACW4TU_30840 [Streptomyces sp. QTS52]
MGYARARPLLETCPVKAERADDRPGATNAFSRAWDARPGHLEACYEPASRLRLKSRYRTAHALLGGVTGGSRPP